MSAKTLPYGAQSPATHAARIAYARACRDGRTPSEDVTAAYVERYAVDWLRFRMLNLPPASVRRVLNHINRELSPNGEAWEPNV